jgi:hypothetical protein
MRNLAAILLAFGLSKSLKYIWRSTTALISPWVTSPLLISDSERAHEDVLSFVATNVLNRRYKVDPGSRLLTVSATKALQEVSDRKNGNVL